MNFLENPKKGESLSNIQKIKQMAVEDFFNLPSLQASVLNLLTVLKNENATLEDITKAVQLDQVVASRVVAMANSSAFGRRKVNTIEEAVFIIGFNTVKAIVLSLKLFHVFPIPYKLMLELWEHSGHVANIAQLLVHPSQRNIAFLAGLLHDIGRVVLINRYKNEYADLITKNGDDLLISEVEKFGYDHALVGKVFFETFNFPDEIVNAVQYHHCKDWTVSVKYKDIIEAVYIAENVLFLITTSNVSDGEIKDKFLEKNKEKISKIIKNKYKL